MNTILLCLALTVFQEARGEPAIGQRAVAAVVLNRARIRDLTVCAAVLEKGQFSWHPEKYVTRTRVGGKISYHIAQDRIPARARGWKQALEAAKYALDHPDTMQNIEFFHSIRVHPVWKLKYRSVFLIGNHVFYARKLAPETRKVVKIRSSGAILG